MVKYLSDMNIESDIVILYLVSDPREFAYITQFNEARAVGVRTIPIVTNTNLTSPKFITSKISAELIERLVPDYQEREFYISGSNIFVDVCKEHLWNLGVAGSRITTDHFSGY